MVEAMPAEHVGKRRGAFGAGFLQRRRRFGDVRSVLERLQPPEILRRDDGGHRLAVAVHDRALAPVLGAAQQV